MIIAVADGGDGASRLSLAASLALSALGSPSHGLIKGRRLAFVDCDTEQPRAGLLLHPRIVHTETVYQPLPEVSSRACTRCGRCVDLCEDRAMALASDRITVFAALCRGCGSCALQCPEGAIHEVPSPIGTAERGRVGSMLFLQGRASRGGSAAAGVLRHIMRAASEEQPDPLVILDLPPGRSSLAILALRRSRYALLVAESTAAGLANLTHAYGIARAHGVPVGLIVCDTGAGDTDVEDYAEKECIPVCLRIPLDGATLRACAGDMPLAVALPQYRARFLELLGRALRGAVL